MKFEQLVEITHDQPVFHTGFLLAGEQNPNTLRVQLARWVKAGMIYRLRRGLYTLAPPYRHIVPHPFLVANQMVQPSYVSLQTALAYHGLIPETVYAITNITTRRPGQWETVLGRFTFRHVRQSFFFGYHLEEVMPGQHAFVASPEKALLDLVYLQPRGDTPAYLEGLRLHDLERLDPERLQSMAKRAGAAKLQRAAEGILALQKREQEAYETL